MKYPGRSAPGLYPWYVAVVFALFFALLFTDRQIIGLLVEPVKSALALSDVKVSLLGSLALIYSTKLTQNYTFTARVSDSYTGPSTDQAYYFGIPLPSYSIVDARAGLSGDKWTATLFVNNITNKVTWNTANNTQFQFNIPQLVRISTNQPRTFGTQINFRF
jgi:hypothetical protein